MINDKLVISTTLTILMSKDGFLSNLYRICFPRDSKYQRTLFRRENVKSGIPKMTRERRKTCQRRESRLFQSCILASLSKFETAFGIRRSPQSSMDRSILRAVSWSRGREGGTGDVARGMLIRSLLLGKSWEFIEVSIPRCIESSRGNGIRDRINSRPPPPPA